MASGVFPAFSPQTISASPKISKGSSSKLEIFYEPPKSKCYNSRFLKLRAAAAKSIQSDSDDDDALQKFLKKDYNSKYGLSKKTDSFTIPKGLSEETIRLISSRKEEPDWMLEFRLNSYRKFCQMMEPEWSPKTDFENICFYSGPKKKPTLNSLHEADPELINYFDKLKIPLNDAVLDRGSIAMNYSKTLENSGVIFCSISEAIKNHPDKVKKYLGKVVSPDDNFYAALNSAVFSHGYFVYVPKDTKCPTQISTYFRINDLETGQFERTLIIADDRSFVQYLESCKTPSYDTNQLHAAVVEIHCNEEAEIKYYTVQNWYAGVENKMMSGIYNFVTKKGLCVGRKSKISWTQVAPGSAVTLNYPIVVLESDDSVGEF